MDNITSEQVLKRCIEKTLNAKIYLELFSLFISSNPDFKYNHSYLTDSIEPFINAISIIRKKSQNYKRLIDKLALQTPKNIKRTIVFDDLFEYKILKSVASDVQLIHVEKFRFDQFKEDEFVVKFIWEVNNVLKRSRIYRIKLKEKQKVITLWEAFLNN